MATVNKVIIVGNLGQDPEVRQFDNGNKMATINVATSERWTDKQTGEQREHTEWHRIIFNNRLAEIVGQYMRKGSSIYVEGSLRTRKWTDQQGIERYTTEIRADSMQMLGGGQSQNQGHANQGGYAQHKAVINNHHSKATIKPHKSQTGKDSHHNKGSGIISLWVKDSHKAIKGNPPHKGKPHKLNIIKKSMDTQPISLLGKHPIP